MAYKDLQIQILEDVASTCQQQFDGRDAKDGFFLVKLGDCSRHLKRRRPAEMLDNLRDIISEEPVKEWEAEDLLAKMGWQKDRGSKTSLGKAMAVLGIKYRPKTKQLSQALLQLTESLPLVVFEGCTSEDLCHRVDLEASRGNLTRVGMAMSKLGWKRQRTYRPEDRGTLWRWYRS